MPLDPRAIQDWTNLFESARTRSAQRPHYGDIAQANRDLNVSNAGIAGSQAQFAPQLYGSQAQNAENQAGLSGVNLQYAPQLKQQAMQTGGLNNQLQQMKIQQLQAAMNAPQKYVAASDIGDMLQDREDAVGTYGPESGQVKLFDQMLQHKMQGKGGIVVRDQLTGNPLVSIGGSQPFQAPSGAMLTGESEGNLRAQLPKGMITKQIEAVQTGERLEKLTNKIQKQFAPFSTARSRNAVSLQGAANKYFSGYIPGVDFQKPSDLIEAEQNVKLWADKFMRDEGIQISAEQQKHFEEFIKMNPQESGEGYSGRIGTYLEGLAEENMERQETLKYGVSLKEGKGAKRKRKLNVLTGIIE